MSSTTTDRVDQQPSDDAGVEGPAGSATAPPWAAGHVILAVVVALLVGTLLNAQDLLATAERQPFGWQRDVAVAVASPVARVSAAIGLDRPRNGIDAALGRNDDEAPAIDDAPDGGGAPVIAAPESDAEADPGPTASDDATASASPTPTPSPTPTETEPAGPMGLDRGPVTADDPLQLYIGGDSMVEIQFGTALQDLADDTGMIDTVAIEFDRGSGLTRPDFVDWPAKLAGVSESMDPDVMVVYFGGNDAQPIKIDGVVYDPTQPEWQAEYRSRVSDLQDQLVEAGHHVYWMGLPIPREDSMVTKFGILNDIYSSEAETRDGVTYVDVWDLFAGADGRYSEYLVNDEGDEVDMRLGDGIHLTTNGAYRAARPTVAQIVEDFEIEPVEESTE
jgi:hypothetical protein